MASNWVYVGGSLGTSMGNFAKQEGRYLEEWCCALLHGGTVVDGFPAVGRKRALLVFHCEVKRET